MPGYVDRPPDIVDTFRRLASRVSELERMNLAAGSASRWQTPSLAGGFTNLGDPHAPVAYYKDFVGRVYLRGGVNHGSGIGSNTTIFTLADGYRPVYKHTFFVAADSAGGDSFQWVVVNTDGTVVANQAGAEAGRMWLDNVQFRTT